MSVIRDLRVIAKDLERIKGGKVVKDGQVKGKQTTVAKTKKVAVVCRPGHS